MAKRRIQKLFGLEASAPLSPATLAGNKKSTPALTFTERKGKLPHSLDRTFSDAAPRLGRSRWAEKPDGGISRFLKRHFASFTHQISAMTEQRVSYTLDSTLETVDSAEQAASRIATEAGFDDDEVMRIAMAVREAAVNAVLHGNAYDPGKKVSLDF